MAQYGLWLAIDVYAWFQRLVHDHRETDLNPFQFCLSGSFPVAKKPENSRADETKGAGSTFYLYRQLPRSVRSAEPTKPISLISRVNRVVAWHGSRVRPDIFFSYQFHAKWN